MEGQFLCSIWTPPWSRKKPHEKGNATQAHTDKYKKGARTLYCIYSFSHTFHNTLSVPSARNLARVQIAAPLCRVFANVILCAQSPRRPEIQANRLKTREAVCCNSPASSRTSIDLRFAGFVTGDPIGVSDEKRMPAEELTMICLRGCWPPTVNYRR